ncbi:hypothetical protein OSB04_un000602 [Centaurea solstitialis]|uniref:non-specific serine/threonine protein kinase n=1 Tax=Centaurea solstitialis TaxID=347529 RepID=A0AA38SH34_9ASTR|nr:hypothetical protein OSB04_un000602 [Centaurea solstitialis]
MVFGCVIGLIEIVCIVVFWWFSTKRSSKIDQSSYFPAATMFQKFTYSELKKASCNFRDEIGRGGASMVYKGRLSDNRIAAIKRLNDTSHRGEAEFQAEISTIWRVNHMNLIETWGYCAEGKHRLVVYEYIKERIVGRKPGTDLGRCTLLSFENDTVAPSKIIRLHLYKIRKFYPWAHKLDGGPCHRGLQGRSVPAGNLKNGKLDWSTRLDIATGTAKGLAYLHEESLEWVLHCDVKPHNILLDANYGPKVADFGLSRLFDRSDIIGDMNFSMIRGTRGYMAPEWVFNLPITSKVDVFSYGVVVLEMITGLSPLSINQANGEVELIEWVRSRIRELDQNRTESWVEKIVDRSISGEYDRTAMENLVRIALQCVEEDREARPSMTQVVGMLVHAAHSYKLTMAKSFLLLFLLTIISSSSSSSSSSLLSHGLTRGSSLSVENKDELLVSPNGLFTAGFHEIGENAYAFAVWFSGQHTPENRTVVWMANRDAPINGRRSKLSLRKDGNLVLIDAGRHVIWSTDTKSTSLSLRLQLRNTGNLVLDDGGGRTIWESFDYPTDTLLPNQPFTKNTKLVSSRSRTNCSSGFYKMFFDTDGILRLIYDALETTTIYWPHPSSLSWESGRLQYMYNRRAMLDSDGRFNSSDGWKFQSADFGMDRQRIMRIDVDGNVRVYSLVEHENRMKLEVQWQAMSHPCKIHGICGPNSLCTYSRDSGRKCRCLPGYTIVNPRDPSSGCEPEFKTTCLEDECDFIELRHVEFYGYDVRLYGNYTLGDCKQDCLRDDTCLGFQYGFGLKKNSGTFYYCCIKNSLQNGYELGHDYSMYIKLPKRLVSSFKQKNGRQIELHRLSAPDVNNDHEVV